MIEDKFLKKGWFINSIGDGRRRMDIKISRVKRSGKSRTGVKIHITRKQEKNRQKKECVSVGPEALARVGVCARK
jgi:hypothetical protein